MLEHVVVRSSQAGVIFGELVSTDGQMYTLKNSRKAWYWKGAFGPEGLASRGPGVGSKISATVDQTVHGVCQVITCTPKAVEAWQGAPEHTGE